MGIDFARILRQATTVLVGIGLTTFPLSTLADSGNGATPNPALLAALVAVGGGPEAFSAKTLRARLGGTAEAAKLSASLGADSLARFDDVFTFVVRDGLATMKQSGAPLPAAAPAPSDPKAVAVALFQAGAENGKLNVERLFDTLFSPNVHMHAMMAVGQRYGTAGETAYHQVFGRLVADVGGNGAPLASGDDDMKNMDMNGMDMKGMPMPSPTSTHAPA
jgi:hypothetical protein